MSNSIHVIANLIALASVYIAPWLSGLVVTYTLFRGARALTAEVRTRGLLRKAHDPRLHLIRRLLEQEEINDAEFTEARLQLEQVLRHLENAGRLSHRDKFFVEGGLHQKNRSGERRYARQLVAL